MMAPPAGLELVNSSWRFLEVGGLVPLRLSRTWLEVGVWYELRGPHAINQNTRRLDAQVQSVSALAAPAR